MSSENCPWSPNYIPPPIPEEAKDADGFYNGLNEWNPHFKLNRWNANDVTNFMNNEFPEGTWRIVKPNDNGPVFSSTLYLSNVVVTLTGQENWVPQSWNEYLEYGSDGESTRAKIVEILNSTNHGYLVLNGLSCPRTIHVCSACNYVTTEAQVYFSHSKIPHFI